MAKHKPKKQHYVPQAYLERFAVDGQLSVYDIDTDRVFASSPRDVGHENGFYDYAPDTTLEDGQPHRDLSEVESILDKLDSMQGARIAAVLHQATAAPTLSMSRVLRWLCLPLLIQFNRTKLMREVLFELLNKSGQDLVN